jgi:Domain of Unknown Function (DUF1080)
LHYPRAPIIGITAISMTSPVGVIDTTQRFSCQMTFFSDHSTGKIDRIGGIVIPPPLHWPQSFRLPQPEGFPMCRLLPMLPLLVVAAALTAAPAPDDKKDTDKWVSLFNGKDLTGWKAHPDDKARWSVKDGAIVGEGPAGHLFTERGDFKNFRYKMTAKISDKGNSGQYFRAKFAKAFPPGYEAQIDSTHSDPIRTGSLYPDGRWCKLTGAEREKLLVKEMLVPPDEFFTQEVIAVGNHIVIKVNGKTTVDFTDAKNSYTEGHFAIQQHNEGSVVTVKAVEVIELP